MTLGSRLLGFPISLLSSLATFERAMENMLQLVAEQVSLPASCLQKFKAQWVILAFKQLQSLLVQTDGGFFSDFVFFSEYQMQKYIWFFISLIPVRNMHQQPNLWFSLSYLFTFLFQLNCSYLEPKRLLVGECHLLTSFPGGNLQNCQDFFNTTLIHSTCQFIERYKKYLILTTG